MKLLRLEWKKINPAPYLGAALGLLALSIFIALLFCFLPESERGAAELEFVSGWRSLILLVSCVTLFSHAMLGAVLSSKVILGEFLGKNRLLVFSWPVSRRQLFAAKTTLIFLFTAAGAFLCNLLSVSTALFFSALFHGFPGAFLPSDLGYLLLVSFCIALLASCICLVAVWFGFRRKSSTAVIVAALILIAPMTNIAAAGMYGGFSFLAFTLIMGIVFLFVYRKLSAKVTVMEVL
nr:ABC transporter permease [uncultured Eisenbergiella sp.]